VNALAETWLIAFLLFSGLGLGSVAALAMGRLLVEEWVEPLQGVLGAMGRWMPLAALVLALPMYWLAPLLWPWAAPGATPNAWYFPGFVSARSLLLPALWAGLGWWLLAGGARWRAGIVLLILLPTGAIAMDDWALSRDQAWSGSVQGVAMVTGQVAGALSIAALLAGPPGGVAARTGLSRALLSLALAVVWLWFTQYIVVYAGNIPAEAAWYLRRSEGGWGLLKLGVALPAVLGAIVLGILPQWRDWRFVAVCALLVLALLADLIWLVRPDAAPGGTSLLLDLALLLPAVVLTLVLLRRV